MHFTAYLVPALLAIQPILANPMSPVVKDQVKLPYCTIAMCALFCEYKGRADTGGFTLHCDSKVPAVFNCQQNCKENATAGYNQHFDTEAARTAMKAKKIYAGGYSWANGVFTKCKDTAHKLTDAIKEGDCMH